MIGTICLSVLFAVVIHYYIKSRRKEGLPPGPTLRFPLLGHGYYFFKGQILGFQKLKDEYGKIFNVLVGPLEMTHITDYELCHEVMSKDAFSARVNLEKHMQNGIMSWLKGGTGQHGLIGNFGQEWQEQRKFTLRHLKEFGFGKASMTDMITEEWTALAELLNEAHAKDEDVQIRLLFNLSVLNVLWRIVAGRRFELNDNDQLDRLKSLVNTIAQFRLTNVGFIIGMMLPKWLQWMNFTMKPIKALHDQMFNMFEEEYKEHQKSYDPNYMRDFIDVYMSERVRVNKKKDTSSSFYGETGRWNYLNTMFDLFLAGSDTTSTALEFIVLYLLHHPSLQRGLQEEIDSIVGRDRHPTLEDRENMPNVVAFISEVHRRAAVTPFGVPHANPQAVELKGYRFPENHAVVANLALIMNDPNNFPDPEKFDPSRFIDRETGKYKPSPYLCQYGMGKRECLGVALAKNIQFIYVTCMLQAFNVEPSSTEKLPGVEEANIALTRVPVPFSARFVPRGK